MSEDRATLLWLAERVEQTMKASPSLMPLSGAICVTCGHAREAHAVAGDADNPEPWPCRYPKLLGAPHPLCDCPDYLPQSDDDDIPSYTI